MFKIIIASLFITTLSYGSENDKLINLTNKLNFTQDTSLNFNGYLYEDGIKLPATKERYNTLSKKEKRIIKGISNYIVILDKYEKSSKKERERIRKKGPIFLNNTNAAIKFPFNSRYLPLTDPLNTAINLLAIVNYGKVSYLYLAISKDKAKIRKRMLKIFKKQGMTKKDLKYLEKFDNPKITPTRVIVVPMVKKNNKFISTETTWLNTKEDFFIDQVHPEILKYFNHKYNDIENNNMVNSKKKDKISVRFNPDNNSKALKFIELEFNGKYFKKPISINNKQICKDNPKSDICLLQLAFSKNKTDFINKDRDKVISNHSSKEKTNIFITNLLMDKKTFNNLTKYSIDNTDIKISMLLFYKDIVFVFGKSFYSDGTTELLETMIFEDGRYKLTRSLSFNSYTPLTRAFDKMQIVINKKLKQGDSFIKVNGKKVK